MVPPDYHNSIVNLAAAVGSALGGGPSPYGPPACLPASCLEGRPLALVVVDGLGLDLLTSFPESFLQGRLVGRLTSVFPSTTASAITSLATAVAPQQHAITGWYVYLRELGSVATILKFCPRHGGVPYSQAGVSAASVIGAPSLASRVAAPVHCLYPREIVDSDYSAALAAGAARHGFDGLADFFARLERLIAMEPDGLVFAYWADLDAIAHRYGVASRETRDHFLALDAGFRELAAGLAGRGATVLVSADHGLIDTDRQHVIRLEDHPELAAMLALPLCGDPRMPYCYLREGKAGEFRHYVRRELGECCEAVASRQLVAEGYLGRGRPHAALLQRLGDYALIMREPFVLCDRLPNEAPLASIGVHGGLSRSEMEVPLVVL